MFAAPVLKRSLLLPLLVLYGLGTTIGAGIYALIGEVAGPSVLVPRRHGY
jgi:L-asparagine transporter-like permease